MTLSHFVTAFLQPQGSTYAIHFKSRRALTVSINFPLMARIVPTNVSLKFSQYASHQDCVSFLTSTSMEYQIKYLSYASNLDV